MPRAPPHSPFSRPPHCRCSHTCVGVLLATLLEMIMHSAYGLERTPVTDVVTTLVSVAGGALLQLSSKAKGFWQTLNSTEQCDAVHNNVSLLAFMIGESASIITAGILILRWRRKPPFGLNQYVAIGLLLARPARGWYLCANQSRRTDHVLRTISRVCNVRP